MTLLIHYFKELFKDRDFMKKALMIAIPLMLQQLIVNSVNLVDNLMVGQLGDYSLSAVSSANRFYFIATMGTNGMIAASIIFLSQFNGANNYDKMKETFRFSFISSFILCFVFFTAALLFPSSIIHFFINDATIISIGSTYLKIACFSYLPMVISLCVSNALRAMGETKLPLCISIVSVVTNVILDYLLIFGFKFIPAMGVAGAAIATLAARVLEAIIYLIVLHKNDYPFKTKIKDMFKIDGHLAMSILKKALPLCVNEILWSGGMATLLKFYSTRGVAANTGYSVSSTVADLFYVLFTGMATASTVLIGTALGANKIDEARDSGYKLICFSMMLSLVFGSMMFTSSFAVPYIFNVSAEAQTIASNFLRVMSVLFWLYMFNTQCYFTLRAGGDTKSTMFMDSVYMWTINLPFVGLLAYYTNINIYLLYIAGQCTDFIKAILSFHLVRKEKWVRNLTH